MTKNNNPQLENKLFTIGAVLLLLFIYTCSGISSIFGVFGELSYNNLGTLTIPAVFLFILVCFFGVINERIYFVLLIFVVIAFPAPIDDIFPSVLLTNPNDAGSAVFPLFTRIDIYLLLGIILKLYKSRFKIRPLQLTLILKLFLLLLTSVFIINFFKSKDFLDLNLYLSYSFHIRYLILFFFLCQLYNIERFEKQIVVSFILSLSFLLLEAYVNTKLNGLDRLSSGSLALNTFANITAAIAVYFIFLIKNKKINKLVGLICLLVAGVILIGSGTRSAFIILVLSLLALRFIESPRYIAINFLKVSIIGALLFWGYVHFSENKVIPDRYSYEYLEKKIDINLSKRELKKIFNVEMSWETNSLITRLNLFDSSLNMIEENPLTGIGVGRWNRYKNEYSVNREIDKVLIDSHNDYLAILSQYGIPLGLLISYIVFFYPRRLIGKRKYTNKTALSFLYVISFTMGAAALSNAGFFKHQVAGLLLFCLCVHNKLYFDNEKDDTISE